MEGCPVRIFDNRVAMIEAITGPLIVQPECWQVVFSRETTSRWIRRFPGEFKHVSAYAYVPFLHVWLFFDPHIAGTDIILTAEGDPALAMISSWLKNATVVSVCKKTVLKYNPNYTNPMPILGYCVPAVRRLVGVPRRRGTLPTVDGFFKDCVACGGVPLESQAIDGSAPLRTAAT